MLLLFFFCWFSRDSLMQNSHFGTLIPGTDRNSEAERGHKREDFPPINNAPSWRGRRDEPRGHQSGPREACQSKRFMTRFVLRLHQTCFGRVVGVWGRRGVHCLFYASTLHCLQSVFSLKIRRVRIANHDFTTLRYNKGLGRRDEKDGLLFYMQNIFKETWRKGKW